MNERYTDINAQATNRWVDDGWVWGQPVSHAVFERAKAGDRDVLLTPTKPVPRAWFGQMKGARVPGLASGGLFRKAAG